MVWTEVRRQVRPDAITAIDIARVPPILIASAAALPLLFLPSLHQAMLAILLVAIFGISHGASDHLMARAGWRSRFGSHWLAVFVVAYVALISVVFAIWIVAPAAALFGFLCLAAVHFALDDLPEPFRPQFLPEMLGRGLFPVTAAAYLHRTELEEIFTGLLMQPGTASQFAGAMAILSIPATLALVWACLQRFHRGETSLALELVTLLVVLLLFPPVPGFALYFCFVHARRQLKRRYRTLGLRPAEYRARFLPYSLGGAAVLMLTLFFTNSVGGILIAGLAALTVPHMLLPTRFSKRT